jgi:hypothetical protein
VSPAAKVDKIDYLCSYEHINTKLRSVPLSRPLLNFHNATTDFPSLQDFGDEAIRPRAFPVKRADSGSGDDPRDDSSEHVGDIMRSDIDPRRANQQGAS